MNYSESGHTLQDKIPKQDNNSNVQNSKKYPMLQNKIVKAMKQQSTKQ